jgi:16S rRNA (cytidine1402-2'-O)-methyltransferase
VSDPGARVVTGAHERGLAVSVVPGPSAVTSALAVAGFGADRFAFEGFLPRRGVEREQRLRRIAEEDRPIVLFASPNRIADDLGDLASHVEGTRRVAIAREMTKLHEEVWVGSLGDAVEHWSGEVKGEVTLVLDAGAPRTTSDEEAIAIGRALIAEGHSLSDAARKASDESGVSRRVIYEALLADQGES